MKDDLGEFTFSSWLELDLRALISGVAFATVVGVGLLSNDVPSSKLCWVTLESISGNLSPSIVLLQ